jgi:hypothetical protein
MYFDINRQIADDLNKTEAILHHAKGAGVLLAIDSNSMSTSWHDTQTNRGRILEEFLISKHLHTMNEKSTLTIFLNSRDSSSIDLTVISNQLLRAVEHLEVSDQESSSDHSIIKFAIGQGSWSRSKQENQGIRYIAKSEDIIKFQGNLLRLLDERLNTTNTEGGLVDPDVTLRKRVNEGTYIEKLIDEFQEMLQSACDKSFRQQRTTKKTTTNKSVPWWTDELTVMR